MEASKKTFGLLLQTEVLTFSLFLSFLITKVHNFRGDPTSEVFFKF